MVTKLAVFRKALIVKLRQSTCQSGHKHQCTNWRALPGLRVSGRRGGEAMSQVRVLPLSLWMKKELVVGVKLKLPYRSSHSPPYAALILLALFPWGGGGLQVPQPQAAYVLIFN